MSRRLFLALALLGPTACRAPALPEGGAAERDSTAGRRIFERKCASCHNANGDGRTIVAGHFRYANLIDGVWRSGGGSASIEQQVRFGRDPMPRFQGKLTDEEIRQVVAYVVALARAREGCDAKPGAGAR